MIVSNPPYITDQAMETLETEVKTYDPDLALRGGDDGLMAYREILMQAQAYLKPKGWLGFEIGFDQGQALQDLLDGHQCRKRFGRFGPCGLGAKI